MKGIKYSAELLFIIFIAIIFFVLAMLLISGDAQGGRTALDYIKNIRNLF